MEAKAIARMVRMSPRKVRLVVDQIRGKWVNEAYAILEFSNKFAAEPVGKTLRSAVANAQEKAKGSGEASAMGRGSPRRRRTSHITVIVNTED